MPGSTTKGVPYSLGADAADTIDTTMQSMAEWVDTHGASISALTTTQRDALAGAARWTNRVIWNTTNLREERWTGSAWEPQERRLFARHFMFGGSL